MTTFDFALVAILIFSIYRGYRSGLITGLFAFVGLVGGGILGLKYGAQFVSQNDSPTSRIGLTAGIVVASAFVFQFLLGDVLIANFALFAPSVTNGQWWLLITAGFLHGSIIHLLFNVYILWVLGSQLENIVGKTKFIIIYFGSLLGGSLASYLFSPFGSYSIGASGAIFGLMGAMLVVGRKRNLDISQITTLVVINVVIGFVLSGIDWRAHLGGLAAGAFITWVLINATSLKGKNQR